MKKYLGILSFLLVLPLTVTGTAKAQTPEEVAAQKQRIEATYASANTALNQLLANPAIHYSFNQTQATFLRTNIDLTVGNFLDNSPLIQMIRPMLVAKVRKDVREGIRAGQIRMDQIQRTTKDEIELEVLEVAREVLRESGRTEKEVMSAKIYLAQGNVNAYTFSAQDGEIVIVLQSDLLDKLTFTRNENIDGKSIPMSHVKKDLLKAVFAHENGHIKSGHILQGVENLAMMMQVFKFFVFDPSLNGNEGDDEAKHNHLWDDMMTKLTPSLFATGEKANSSSGSKNTLTEAAKFLSSQLDEVLAKNPDAVKSLLNPYLDMLINIVLQNGEMNGGVLNTLVMLRSSTAVPRSQDPRQLERVFREVAALMSREMETSADMYTFNSVARLFAAAVFTSFQGTPMKMSPDLRDRYLAGLISAVENLLKEGKEFYDTSTEEEVAAMLSGADVDHPQGPLRVENILRYARTLDAMAMQNPILKLVVTHTGLLDILRIDERNQGILQNALSEIRPLIEKTKNPELDAKLAEYEKLLTEEHIAEDQLKEAIALVAKVTAREVGQLGYNGDLKSNPLLADVLDFQFSRKIRNLWVEWELYGALGSAPNLEEKQSLKEKIEFYQVRFNDGDDLIKKIRAKVKNSKGKDKKAILDMIDKALDPNLTIEKARSYRTDLQALAGFDDNWLERRSRPAVGDENVDISRQSSIKDKHLKPEVRAAREAKNLAILARGNFSEDEQKETTLLVNQGAIIAAQVQACAAKLKKPLSK